MQTLYQVYSSTPSILHHKRCCYASHSAEVRPRLLLQGCTLCFPKAFFNSPNHEDRAAPRVSDLHPLQSASHNKHFGYFKRRVHRRTPRHCAQQEVKLGVAVCRPLQFLLCALKWSYYIPSWNRGPQIQGTPPVSRPLPP